MWLANIQTQGVWQSPHSSNTVLLEELLWELSCVKEMLTGACLPWAGLESIPPSHSLQQFTVNIWSFVPSRPFFWYFSVWHEFSNQVTSTLILFHLSFLFSDFFLKIMKTHGYKKGFFSCTPTLILLLATAASSWRHYVRSNRPSKTSLSWDKT